MFVQSHQKILLEKEKYGYWKKLSMDYETREYQKNC